jgi:shikimate dehydrogenase
MYTIGLVGKHLSHSFSQKYFTEKFQKLGMNDYKYVNFEINSVDEILEIIKQDDSIIGFNVTIPYKKEILNVLSFIDDDAKKIGAVNTVKVIRHTNKIELHGYNTDAYGFQFSVKPFLTLHHQKALILGTGGAAHAIDYVLKKLGIDTLFVSRNTKNENCVLYADINEYAINQFKLILNCTPIGMFPNSEVLIDIPYSALTSEHLCVDLIYNPAKTKFLENAEDRNATILNGLSMLHLQADKAFEIFTSF